jgi:hypothetical protein
MVRRQRRWVAILMTLGLVFAQFVTITHACTFAIPISSTALTLGQPVDETMPSDCAAMAKYTTANANVCQSHCTYGQQIDVQPHAPVAAIAPQPALTVRVMSSPGGTSVNANLPRAQSTAPPLSVLFSRFLI